MKEYILPFKNVISHPGVAIPLRIAGDSYIISCLENAMASTRQLILVPQREEKHPIRAEKFFETGTLAEIVQLARTPGDEIVATIQTLEVVNIKKMSRDKNGLFVAEFEIIPQIMGQDEEKVKVLRQKIFDILDSLYPQRKYKKDKFIESLSNMPLGGFIDSILRTTNASIDTSVKILKTPAWADKLLMLLGHVKTATELMRIDEEIEASIQKRISSAHRTVIMQEKMQALEQMIGEAEGNEFNVNDIRKRIEGAHLPASVHEKAMSEFRRMRTVSPMSNEGGLLKTYLDELLSMPWNKSDSVSIDLQEARKILDSEHSGMQSVKERILEHIAVMKKTGTNRGGVLCFVGAPGVGKTSLCQSIANALGRKYHRMSLGGISDEAHLRGHRKTYVGAQPGRIMDALKRCKTNNPVIVLDEIDKMGRDWRGDPESALLEILDPEQNKAFRDHFLEVDFDLSNVMFIATSNTLNLSGPLKDRMEIIEIPGYSEDEKLQIAREHLIARAANDTGWNINNIVISDDAIRHIIRNYTAEQGVRELRRELTAMLRRTLLENDGEDVKTDFTVEKINELLSVHKPFGLSKRIGFM